MPYIGNTAADRFVASKAATQFSGDGSTTAFTLEHSVGADEDILVSVDGVVQEPSVAYAVSSGTTLTFTAAPSSNSGNNIFVYYLFRTVGTVDHPSTSSLQATDGTFSSTLNVTGETTLATHLNLGDNDKIKLGASGDLEIYHDASNSYVDDTGTGRLYLRGNDRVQIQKYTGEDMITCKSDGAVELFHDNAKKFETTSAGATLTGNLTVTDGHVSSGVNHTYNLFGATGTGGSASYVTYSFVGDPNTGMFSGTADTLKFATGGTERMRIDGSGNVTKSNQPSFLARPSSRQSNLAINTNHTIAFGTEVFDRGADFASNTFTAPIEGLYQLNVQLAIQEMDSATDYYYINLKTSNRNYDQYWDNNDKAGDNGNGAGVTIAVLADMDAGDTAVVEISVANSGTAQMDVETASTFSGFLAC